MEPPDVPNVDLPDVPNVSEATLVVVRSLVLTIFITFVPLKMLETVDACLMWNPWMSVLGVEFQDVHVPDVQ
jgi:hypothetical protein